MVDYEMNLPLEVELPAELERGERALWMDHFLVSIGRDEPMPIARAQAMRAIEVARELVRYETTNNAMS
jgi:hypothetical protein